MKKSTVKLINEQINAELYSAYLYLAFADYYEEEGLSGYANYFEIQAAEERDHALIFRKYLHENGEKVTLSEIKKPEVEFKSFIEPLEKALDLYEEAIRLGNSCADLIDTTDFSLEELEMVSGEASPADEAADEAGAEGRQPAEIQGQGEEA